jgi:hypothetical protein
MYRYPVRTCNADLDTDSFGRCVYPVIESDPPCGVGNETEPSDEAKTELARPVWLYPTHQGSSAGGFEILCRRDRRFVTYVLSRRITRPLAEAVALKILSRRIVDKYWIWAAMIECTTSKQIKGPETY